MQFERKNALERKLNGGKKTRESMSQWTAAAIELYAAESAIQVNSRTKLDLIANNAYNAWMPKIMTLLQAVINTWNQHHENQRLVNSSERKMKFIDVRHEVDGC